MNKLAKKSDCLNMKPYPYSNALIAWSKEKIEGYNKAVDDYEKLNNK